MVAVVVLVVALVLAALNAGFFYAFSVNVMRALRTADDADFVRGFRSLDRQVESPLFMSVFLGAPVLAAVGVVVLARSGGGAPLLWSVGALLLALVTVAITGGVHVPMNGRLQRLGPVEEITALHLVRVDFEQRWNRWNHLRTGASALTVTTLALALAAL